VHSSDKNWKWPLFDRCCSWKSHSKFAIPCCLSWSADGTSKARASGIREHLVLFNIFYICVVLGLAVSGEEVSFDNCTHGLVKNLFSKEEITIDKIVVKLREKDNVNNYSRLYIFLVFLVFYFPCTSRIVSTFPFSLLDNLESLHLWNWGEAVHSLMVKTLDRAFHLFRN